MREPSELGHPTPRLLSIVGSEATAGWLSGEGRAKDRTADAERATTKALRVLGLLQARGWNFHLTYTTIWAPREANKAVDALETAAVGRHKAKYWAKEPDRPED